MREIKQNRRGLSPIIATVLLIFLTVSAATFIAGFLFNWFGTQLNETKCFEYTDYFKFENEFGYNCYINAGSDKNYKISVSAKNVKPEVELELKGLGLVFYKLGDSEAVKIIDGSDPTNNLRMLSSPNTQKITIPKSGETRTFNFTSTSNFTSVKVYAILKSKECEAVENINLIMC